MPSHPPFFHPPTHPPARLPSSPIFALLPRSPTVPLKPPLTSACARSPPTPTHSGGASRGAALVRRWPSQQVRYRRRRSCSCSHRRPPLLPPPPPPSLLLLLPPPPLLLPPPVLAALLVSGRRQSTGPSAKCLPACRHAWVPSPAAGASGANGGAVLRRGIPSWIHMPALGIPRSESRDGTITPSPSRGALHSRELSLMLCAAARCWPWRGGQQPARGHRQRRPLIPSVSAAACLSRCCCSRPRVDCARRHPVRRGGGGNRNRRCPPLALPSRPLPAAPAEPGGGA
jgi:hypothetical protein